MARTTSSTTARANVQKTTQEKKTPVVGDVKTTAVETVEPKREVKQTYKVKQELDPNMFVPVRNGFNGKLIYKSRKNGETYVWQSFGDEQDMELSELRAAKVSYKSFFENNWFMIDDPAVIEFLGVERYYKNALKYDDFDSLFEMSPEEIEKKIELLSKGQRASVAYRARQLIAEGGIDSIKVINTLEKMLGITLIER